MKDKKNIAKQINKEVLVTVALYLLYFLWWYYFAYIFPPKNTEDYKYILGMPEWFFYSCVLGLVLINFLVFLATKFLFKDIDFEQFEKNKKD
ncbi:MAG: YhdT family protein [Fusobacterium sp.]|uniref:YhdT family protein n=1 Tax=Fusobacterium sp. TaxID=68766 RepID=UPI0026DBF660|nr:YhdT family protein [Fusobacterium sp.]MDO4690667.1 YhdT family protein [Fusobacterium sp.]